jgi:sulfur relay (sulfurtransferase) DsrC/TusE family protein
MAKIDLEGVAGASAGGDFTDFTKNFQENIANLRNRAKFGQIESDQEFSLDEDGYIVGSIWSEAIAAQMMDLNGFQATTGRIDTLIAAREIYGEGSVPTDHSLVAKFLGLEVKQFVKMFPKYPIIYFTRWGNLRKPFDLQKLRDNPVKA